MVAGRNRILFDVTDLVSLMLLREHPNGIPRVIARCLAELLDREPEVVPVFFSRISRAFCRIDGRRLLARDLDYLRRLNPAARDNLRRARAYMGVLRSSRVVPGPDDTLLLPGAGWGFPKRHGYLFGARPPACRVVWFCHDLIPLRHPEFVMNPGTFGEAFRLWLDAALGRGHRFICASRHVEADLRDYAASQGVPVDVSVVPLAHEFKPVAGPMRDSLSGLAARRTVLCVSSIGLRKNQIALVRGWDRLRREFGDELPTLVLAGEVIEGAELEAFLRRTGNVGGTVELLGPVSESELARLYEFCDFTVFPSLEEGWGLPVGESLWMAKPCLSSGLSSLPEVGGGHVTYFDPRDEAGMAAALCRAMQGEFAALPPPRSRLRTWRQVADGLLAVASG